MIRNQAAFDSKPPAQYDGFFDWSWTKGCFGNPKIEPMDFDGVVERKGQFLVFETKDVGKSIPPGQFITLIEAHKLGCFTIMLIHGKLEPESGFIWWPGVKISRENLGLKFVGLESARGLVRSWWLNADIGAPF